MIYKGVMHLLGDINHVHANCFHRLHAVSQLARFGAFRESELTIFSSLELRELLNSTRKNQLSSERNLEGAGLVTRTARVAHDCTALGNCVHYLHGMATRQA